MNSVPQGTESSGTILELEPPVKLFQNQDFRRLSLLLLVAQASGWAATGIDFNGPRPRVDRERKAKRLGPDYLRQEHLTSPVSLPTSETELVLMVRDGLQAAPDRLQALERVADLVVSSKTAKAFILRFALGSESEVDSESLRERASFLAAYRLHDPRFLRVYRGIKNPSRFFDPSVPVHAVEMRKTSSRTLLLGGKLAGKATLRIVRKESALEWQKAAFASEVWKGGGFSHIPIEPILSRDELDRNYKLSDVDRHTLDLIEAEALTESERTEWAMVYTEVLYGANLWDYPELLQGDLGAEIARQRGQIQSTLEASLQIDHQHPRKNFLAVLSRGEAKVYLIDFDRAVNFNSPNRGRASHRRSESTTHSRSDEPPEF